MNYKLRTVDAETLLSTPMSKTMFIVEGLIPQGVNVISGTSKIGKSWMMLGLELKVAQGPPVWGFQTKPSDVLYLCLEDTQRKIKDRLYNLPILRRVICILPLCADLSEAAWKNKSPIF